MNIMDEGVFLRQFREAAVRPESDLQLTPLSLFRSGYSTPYRADNRNQEIETLLM